MRGNVELFGGERERRSASSQVGVGYSSHGARPQGENGQAAAFDEVMRLVQRVFILPGPTKIPRVIGFCGVNRHAGCTWLCAQVCEVLAGQVPGSVCAVDANLREPALHKRFGIEKASGFAELMKAAKPPREFSRQIGSSNLWVITAGSGGHVPNGALNPGQLRARFAELRSQFDFVLVDTPAIDTYPDATLLAQMTDGVILVVDANATRRETARQAKESLEAAQIPVLGAVLNKRTYPIPDAIYRKI